MITNNNRYAKPSKCDLNYNELRETFDSESSTRMYLTASRLRECM